VPRRLEFSKFLKHMPKPPPTATLSTPNFSFKHLKAVLTTKQPTSPDESKITWKMLKHAPDHIIHSLSALYHKCYTSNTYPTLWHNGITSLIPKPNIPPTSDGFRPITLLNVEYKLYTHVLNKALTEWLIVHNLLPSSQNDALPDRGTDTCLWSMLAVFANSLLTKHPLHALFIDFSKAYDSVKH